MRVKIFEKHGLRLRTVLLVLLTLISLSALAGCWDKRELTDLLYVSGIGLDVPEDGDGVEMSVEFITISSGKDDKITSSVFTTKGGDIGDALTALATRAGGKENFNYCEAIVMSEEYARQGIAKVVEMVMRNSEIQHTALLAVADGCKASELFAAGGEDEPAAAYEISGIMKSNFKSCTSLVKNDAYRIRARLQSPGGCAALTRLYLEEDGDERSIMAGGAAVFKGDKLAGWLTPEEASFFRMATGDAVEGYESIPSAEGGYVSAALRNFKLDTRAELDGGAPSAELRIGADALLLRSPGSAGGAEGAQEGFAGEIERGVRGVFERCRDEMDCDIFGLAGTFGRKYGKRWAAMENDWDELFGKLEFSVQAEVKVEDAGLAKSGE